MEEVNAPLKFNYGRLPDRAGFEEMVRLNVDFSTSPGYPYSLQHHSNGDYFGWDPITETFDPDRMDAAYLRFKGRAASYEEGGEGDPIKLFIKPEPHKVKKALEGAWRMISSVSIIDNLLIWVAYGSYFRNVIANWNKVPAKAGWTPQRGGYKWITRLFDETHCADKSSWDWTVHDYIMDILYDHYDDLAQNSAPEWLPGLWNHLFKNNVFENHGHIFRLRTKGVMKSGIMGTIFFNCDGQLVIHILSLLRTYTYKVARSKADDIATLGDDTVQDAESDAYFEQLGKTGIILKQIDRYTKGVVEFAGHVMRPNSSIPAYRSKHLYTLLHLEPESAAETLESYQFLYTFEPRMLSLIRDMLREVNPEAVRSDRFLRSWYEKVESRIPR